MALLVRADDAEAQVNFVATGINGNIAVSPDGITWSVPTSFPGSSSPLWAVEWNGTHWLVAGGGESFLSPDGQTWIRDPLPFSGTTWGGAKYDGMWVVSGQSGEAACSMDGRSWVPTNWRSNDNILGMGTDGAGLFLALGNSDRAATSNTCLAWQPASSPGFSGRAVLHDNGTWLIGGSGGPTATSTNNGNTWTSGADLGSVYDFAFDGTTYVAVGRSGQISTSPDMVSWTSRSNPFGTSTVYEVAHGAGRFVAVGAGGDIATSPNGITWTSRNSQSSSTFYAIASTGNDMLPNATMSTISAAPSTLVADGQSKSTVTVQARDAFSNNLSVGGATVTLSATDGSLGAVTDNSDGTYTATLQSSPVVGIANVTGTLNGNPIGDWANVTFVPGPSSGNTSTLAASPTTLVADGTTTSAVTLTLYDEHGNRVTQGGHSVDLSVDLGSVSSPVDQGDGTYTATYTSATTVGQATVTGVVDGEDVVDTAVVELVPGPPDGGRSTLEATPDTLLADGSSTSEVLLRLYDAHGNALDQGGHDVELSTDLGDLSAVQDLGDGSYRATLTAPLVLGQATLKAVVADDPVNDEAHVRFVPGDPDPHQSTLTASPLEIPADGEAVSVVTLRLIDAHGHEVGQGGHKVVLQADAGDLSDVVDHQDGTYSAELSGAEAAVVTVEAVMDDVPITQQATVEIYSITPHMGQSLLAAAPTKIVADGVTTSTIELTLRNDHGRAIPFGGHAVEIASTLGALSSVQDHGDGTYTSLLTGTVVGSSQITAIVDGGAVEAVAHVELVPGPPVAAESDLMADPLEIPADGTAGSTLKLDLRDAHGNAVPGLEPVLTTDLGSIGPVMEQGAGMYEAVLRGVDPGTATVSVEGLGLTASVDLLVPAGPLALLLEPTGVLCIEQQVTYHAVAFHGEAAVQKWVFDVDGEVVELESDADRPHRVALTHVHEVSGQKSVQVTAHFEDEAPTDALEHPLMGSCIEPVVDFHHEVSGLDVLFEDLSSDPDDLIVAWQWDFGDGSTSSEQHPLHSYPAYGTYLVRLVVTDVVGRQVYGERVVVVERPAEPQEFQGSGATGLSSSHDAVDQDVAEPDDVVDPSAGTPTATGDGNRTEEKAPFFLTADFTIHQEAPDLFRFVADVPPEATRVLWSFSDGGTAEGKEVQRLFEPGQHHVTLRVEGEGQVVESVQFLRASAEPEAPEPHPVLPVAEADPAEFQETDVEQESSLGGVGWWVVGGLGLAVLLALLVLVVLLRRR